MDKRRALGKAVQKEARRQLESLGWEVEEARASRFQPQDFFSCWDFIAIKNHSFIKESVVINKEPWIRWIQVSASPLSKRGRAYRQKLEDFIGLGGKEYWHWTGDYFEITNL